jgi:FkbM family methyltransferase
METPLKELARPFYHSVMDDEPMQIMALEAPLKGYKMYLNSRWDLRYVYGVYEPLLSETIIHIVRPGWVCLDIGANAGYTALLMARCSGPAGKVIAFEPLPANFAILQRNIALNHAEQQVTCACLALSDAPGEQQFTFRTDTLCGTGSLVNATPTGSEPVSVITVQTAKGDAYLAQSFPATRIHFMKIDVEGAEGLVLGGLSSTLEAHRPQVLLETHDVVGTTSDEALKILRDTGYTLKQIDRNHVLAV